MPTLLSSGSTTGGASSAPSLEKPTTAGPKSSPPAAILSPGQFEAAGISRFADFSVAGPTISNEAFSSDRVHLGGELLRALREKHEPTARHCLRVAFACSDWAQRLHFDARDRERLEFAALLHDVGKLFLPANLLTKPSVLSPAELASVRRHWLLGQDLLRSSETDSDTLGTLLGAGIPFDGGAVRNGVRGTDIPLGSRMLAIVDAFDAITSEQSYRRAATREFAWEELVRCAGKQFDPELVRMFLEAERSQPFNLNMAPPSGWLRDIAPDLVAPPPRVERDYRELLTELQFHRQLLSNMYDAVAFIDGQTRVIQWNRGAERLTGICAEKVLRRTWSPSLLGMRDENGKRMSPDDCPVAFAMRTGVQWRRRLAIASSRTTEIAVDLHLTPIISDGVTHGLIMLMHDVSPEVKLEARCHNLRELATLDPLTRMSNRAEFDREHDRLVAEHARDGRPYGLIIADIDRFKQVNDTYGHPAGDEVIQSFARVLREHCRTGELAARYGGEEFVLLCPDCDSEDAARRAEEVRRAFSALRQPALEGKCCTASFGVSELKPGDTAATMLDRADQALLRAKEGGRNMVVKLSADEDSPNTSGATASIAKTTTSGPPLAAQTIVSADNLTGVANKLRGFADDHHGKIISSDESRVELLVGSERQTLDRRVPDRATRLYVSLAFTTIPAEKPAHRGRRGLQERTLIEVRIWPQRRRERRLAKAESRARELLSALRGYLMAEPVEEGKSPAPTTSA